MAHKTGAFAMTSPAYREVSTARLRPVFKNMANTI